MVRQAWIYPSDGSDPIRKEEYHAPVPSGGVTFLPDLPDFTSPIDGKRYSGRAGMREHNSRHDVVPTADLKGLPLLTANSDTRPSDQKRADAANRKQMLIQQVSKHYR